MSSLAAVQFLVKASHLAQQSKVQIPKDEILKKIGEIKYLSAQKKIPKLSLRKEIVHLEHKLNSIFELDTMLAAQRRRESAKVAALKRQIAALRKNLTAIEDKDLHKKVDRLTHVLGSSLAKKETAREVSLAQKSTQRVQTPAMMPSLPSSPAMEEGIILPPLPVSAEEPAESLSVEERERVALFRQKIKALRREIELAKGTSKDSEHILQLEAQISRIEERVQGYDREPVQTHQPQPPEKVKHTMMFTPPASSRGMPLEERKEEGSEKEEGTLSEMPERKIDVALEKELPLPPPPKMKKPQ